MRMLFVLDPCNKVTLKQSLLCLFYFKQLIGEMFLGWAWGHVPGVPLDPPMQSVDQVSP